MPDDPRDRRLTPRGGSPLPRAITERGGGTGSVSRDRRTPRNTPAYIKQELSRRFEKMTQGDVDFENEEFTPVTTIAVVRGELKEEIQKLGTELEKRIDKTEKSITDMRAEQHQLFGAVKTNNELMPKMLDQLMGMLSSELRTHQTIEEVTVTHKLGNESHREKTAAEIQVFSTKAKWMAIGKIVGFVFSVAGATLILNAILKGC